MNDDFDQIEDSSPVVRYSAKELFAQISRKLDIVLELAQSKASQVEVDELGDRVDGIESRVQTIEDHSSSVRELVKVFAWAVGTTIAVAGVVIAYHALGGSL